MTNVLVEGLKAIQFLSAMHFFLISNVVQREDSTQKMSRAKVLLWICPVSSHNNENEKKGSRINFKFGNIIKFIFRVYF